MLGFIEKYKKKYCATNNLAKISKSWDHVAI